MNGPDGIPRIAGEAEAAYAALLGTLPEDLERDGIADTPARAARAWRELTSGYGGSGPALTTFAATEGERDQIVAVGGIPFYSLCEHHVLPFFGTVSIAYIPGERLLGLSKFARLTDRYARRLQVQERLTAQIARHLSDVLAPDGLLVVVRAEHLCMAMRGVQRQGAQTETSVAWGALRDAGAKAEAMTLLRL